MLRKFHSSLFEPAVANQAQLAPAAIRYRHGDGAMCEEAAYVDGLSFAESLALIIRQRFLIAESTFAETIPSAGKHRREVTALAENAEAKILNVEVPSDKFARSGADLSARAAGFAQGH
jgi:1-acyl-sn-glycerol-3-phosphate acyltransferase